jgi:predicted permease
MSKLFHDLKYAGRVLARERIFSATVILTLGLCMGANAAVFTIVNAVVLRPLPFAAAERLVNATNSYPGAGITEASNAVPDYFDRKAGVAAFEDLALYRTEHRTVGLRTGAERVRGIEATPSLLRLLGARALRGRLFSEQDGERGSEATVILSDAFWQQHFGGRADVVGQTLRLNGTPHTIIGILPATFVFLDADTQIWIPTRFGPQERADDRRHSNSYQMVARLRPGATVAQAQQQIDAINAAQIARSPIRQLLVDVGYATRVMPFHDRLVRDVRQTLYLLWAGVAVVLLIGAVNVTNLTLVRAAGRAREFATRQALGAGGWHIMRQLVAESLLLTMAAGALGLFIAYAIIQATLVSVEDRIPRAFEIRVDAAAVMFTLAVACAVGGLIALLPLFAARRISLGQAVREEGRSGTTGPRVRLLRRALVTTQVAFAFMLLIGGALLFASFREILRVDPGFDPSGVLTGGVSLPETNYPKDDQVIATQQRLLERIQSLPGVAAAGFGSSPPFGDNYSASAIFPEGYVAKPGESVIAPSQNAVSAGYFAALRIPVRRGRAIDARDTATSPPVVVVDERLARHYWPGQDPVGKRMFTPESVEDMSGAPGPKTRWLTVVGVVGTVRQRGLVAVEETIGAYYFASTQRAERTMMLVARTATEPLSAASAIRREVAAVDAEVPFYQVLPLATRVRESVAPRRTAMQLAVGFAALAVLLATVGIYGVLAYQVAQRTREIGIRMALGSEARAVFAMILREGAVLVVVGFAAGLAGTFAMRRAIAGELYGVDATEPAVVAAAAALLAVVALAACAVPARRASRISPAIALTE